MDIETDQVIAATLKHCKDTDTLLIRIRDSIRSAEQHLIKAHEHLKEVAPLLSTSKKTATTLTDKA